MNELTIDDGQFMGHNLRRTQVFLGSRRFIAIPVTLDSAQGSPSGVSLGQMQQAVQGLKNSSSSSSMAQQQMMASQGQAPPPPQPPITAQHALAQRAQQQMLSHASPNMVLPAGAAPAMNTGQHLLDALRYGVGVLKTPAMPPLVVDSSPTGRLKQIDASVSQPVRSKLESSIYQRFKNFLKPGAVIPVKSTSDIDTYPVHMSGGVFDDAAASEPMPQVPSPERSAYDHADVTRAVPLIRLEAQPNFFLNDTVGMAMVNSIDSVCDTKHGPELGSDVRRMRAAVYRPLGMYKPDVDGPWTGSKDTSSLFFRQTIHLDKDWDLDIRHACGTYNAGGRVWLGVFVHGMAVTATNTPSQGFGQPRRLSPTEDNEEKYFLMHRGAIEPTGLFFDLFIPCEPEVITEEWGWGADLEELTAARQDNAAKDAKSHAGTAFPANKWDRKSMSHKSNREINESQVKIDHEARVLGERYMEALKERERARQVLYSYAWKALMLGVMECRQLTVERY